MQRRAEFSFQGSPARGRLLPPRPPPPPTGNNSLMAPPRYGAEVDDEEARWLQASLQASPDYDSSGGGSGTPSPQLWARHPHQLPHRQYPASAGSSPSRAQAIAGYRREMLDLVRGLPESAYELSLRDIVEHHHPPSPPSPPSLSSPPLPPAAPPSSTTAGRHASHAVPVPVPVPAHERLRDAEPAVAAAAATATADAEDGVSWGKKKKKQGRKQRTTAATMRRQRSRRMERSVSLDTGLLINLFLPLSVRGGKKKPDAAAKDDNNNKKKQSKEEDKKKKKQGKKKEAVVAPPPEEEWWSKSEFSEAGSSSRTSSTGSSNSNSSAASVRNVSGGAIPRAPARNLSRKRTGCYAFFRPNKGKNGVNQD